MTTSKIWGGRFQEGPAAIMREINVSLGFDRKLAFHDIEGSKAHAAMLVTCKILTPEDGKAIDKGLSQISAEIKDGSFPYRDELEDIHMNIETRLYELIGNAALRLHTARSRNDQTVTDLRMWLRDQIDSQLNAIRACQKALVSQAEKFTELAMPGYTHLQTAQPVSFAHHLMAYVEMLGRDYGRLSDARKRLNECPLGAAALAGTPYPIDREFTAKKLGFDRPMRNSMDAVSARDFLLEYACAAGICATHLSRLAEEFILWMNDRFGFVRLPDALTTGSSIMPQKRNPDAAELVRAKPARIWGDAQNLAMMLKALPLTYSKDLQEDKEAVFDAAANLDLVIAAMTAMISDLTPNPDAMKGALEKGFPTATDLADWLVMNLNLPFRKAHHITGAMVKLAEDKGIDLAAIPLSDMQAIEPKITADIYKSLTVEASLKARKSFGGTAPDTVKAAINAFKRGS